MTDQEIARALEIIRTAADEPGEDGSLKGLRELLTQFGLWSRRGTGEPRYTTPLGARYRSDEDVKTPRPVVTISDSTALVLSRIICLVSAFHRCGAAVFQAVYVRDVDFAFADRNPLVRMAFRRRRIPVNRETVWAVHDEFLRFLRRKIFTVQIWQLRM